MMNDEAKIAEVFAKTRIDGLNFEESIEHFGGNIKLYVKILRTFADNINSHLESLDGLTREKLDGYVIVVHGVKGICYSVGANKVGDMAQSLEVAAKRGDFEKVCEGKAPFLEALNSLVTKIRALLDEIESGSEARPERPEPDKALLAAMLKACRDYDADMMQETMEELEKYEYESGGDLVEWLGGQVTFFAYERIEERLQALLI